MKHSRIAGPLTSFTRLDEDFLTCGMSHISSEEEGDGRGKEGRKIPKFVKMVV